MTTTFNVGDSVFIVGDGGRRRFTDTIAKSGREYYTLAGGLRICKARMRAGDLRYGFEYDVFRSESDWKAEEYRKSLILELREKLLRVPDETSIEQVLEAAKLLGVSIGVRPTWTRERTEGRG